VFDSDYRRTVTKMTPEYLKAQEMIQGAIAHKVISLPTRLAKRYERNDYNPRFALADRDGQLICIWCGNKKKANKKGKGGDVEIVRLSNRDVTEGLLVEDKNGRGNSWPEVTRAVMRHFRMRATD